MLLDPRSTHTLLWRFLTGVGPDPSLNMSKHLQFNQPDFVQPTLGSMRLPPLPPPRANRRMLAKSREADDVGLEARLRGLRGSESQDENGSNMLAEGGWNKWMSALFGPVLQGENQARSTHPHFNLNTKEFLNLQLLQGTIVALSPKQRWGETSGPVVSPRQGLAELTLAEVTLAGLRVEKSKDHAEMALPEHPDRVTAPFWGCCTLYISSMFFLAPLGLCLDPKAHMFFSDPQKAVERVGVVVSRTRSLRS